MIMRIRPQKIWNLDWGITFYNYSWLSEELEIIVRLGNFVQENWPYGGFFEKIVESSGKIVEILEIHDDVTVTKTPFPRLQQSIIILKL